MNISQPIVDRRRASAAERRPRTASRRGAGALVALAAVVMLAGCTSAGMSPMAISRDAEGEFGRYMGGGTHFGRVRRANEGMWARDYAGLDVLYLIDLRYSPWAAQHGDGFGSY